MYETKRVKPGIKAGAIENIHRRLGGSALVEACKLVGNFTKSLIDDLESRITGQRATTDGPSRLEAQTANPPASGDAAHGVLTLLARELPKLLGAAISEKRRPCEDGSTSVKRRRLDQDGTSDTETSANPPLPSLELTKLLVDYHFTHIHPWIPMLNQDRFRQKVNDPDELSRLEIIIHAIHVAVAKYLDDTDTMVPAWPADRIRRWVTMTAMDTLSIESLQALIIIAFHEVSISILS